MERSALQRQVSRKQDCELFLKEYEQGFAELRADPTASAEIDAERSALDGTLMDGLEDEPA
ncbi:MAG TPA: hypothetical protein VF613_11200 [Longimicrobium sp.]|jgi:hypothetical protein